MICIDQNQLVFELMIYVILDDELGFILNRHRYKV